MSAELAEGGSPSTSSASARVIRPRGGGAAFGRGPGLAALPRHQLQVQRLGHIDDGRGDVAICGNAPSAVLRQYI